MKVISKTIYLSVFSLVCPAISFASIPSAYASLVDTSQNQTFESEPPALGLVLPGRESSHLKLANVKFIIGDRDLDFGERNFAEKDLCQMQGFRLTSCPAGYIKGEVCPYDSKLIKECIAPVSWCKSNGYDVTSCTVPKYPANPCPYLSSLYKSCEVDNIRACKEAGYSLTCETGKVGDKSCPYNSSYKTCVCNPCSGYTYTAAQASAQGYAPGEVCNSCGTIKYKRTENKCEGFKTCECGGETNAKVCYSGSVKKYNSCKSCCDSKYQYDSSNCSGDKQLAGNSCGNKFEKCEVLIKAGDIVYSDMTISSELKSGKTPIAIVFDPKNHLAVSNKSYSHNCFFCHRVSSGLQEYESYNPPLSAKETEAQALADMTGSKNTAQLTAYMKSKNAAVTNGTYYMHKDTFSDIYGLPDSEWFTPALGELKTLYANREAVDAGLRKLGQSFDNLTRGRYSYLVKTFAKVVWSSSYKGKGEAWAYNFDNGKVVFGDVENTENSLRVINYNREQICNSKYVFDASNCVSGLGGDVCGGKYQTCQTVRTLPLVYDDKTISYSYDPNKYVIGIVIDEASRLAIAINGTSGMVTDSFEGNLSGSKPKLKAIEGLKNCTKENIRICDADGYKNTKAILNFGAKIGQAYPTIERVNGRSFVWGMEGADNCNCWYGKGKWFVPSAAQILKFYDIYERVLATAKLIPSTIVHRGHRYGYNPRFDPRMSSTQVDAEHYWSVSGKSTLDNPLTENSKWPYPSISSNGTIQFAGEDTLPMIYY